VLHLVHGNRFEDLAARLAEDLAAARRTGAIDVFTPVTIAVPGALVAGGLRLALARQHGIAANLRFPSLETLLAELALRARPDWLVLQRRMLQSLLVGLLGDDERLAGEELAPVRRYASAGAAREVRRVQLAGELAALFTDYALTRPEMVAGWGRGEGDGWQPRLWREVAAAGERAAQRAGRARAGLVAQLFAELPPGELAGVGPVHLFGFSYLARGVRPLLARLARAVEVRIYNPNPCREFWEDAGEASDDNPALAAWGRAGREHVAALNELDVGAFAETFAEPEARGALGRLQRDILERAPRRGAADRPATGSGDSSVHVLACPGVRRELEAIGGAITGMLAADPSLRLCDVAVLLAPDGCERYQAQIGAVFDELGGIAHRRLELPLAGESRVVQAVCALLDLPLGRFTRAELLGLMVHPAVLARFPDVDRDDWVRWCDELGIVHGGDRADHQGTYIEGDVYNWDQGLRRLALGSFMEVGERPVAVRLGAQAYVPARVAADERRSAARFALLARTLLAAARDQRDRPRPLAEWARDLDRLVAAHIAAPERDDEKVLERLRQCIRDLAELDLDGRAVDHATARELLREAMDHLRSPGGELPTDAVLVAPLGPMRAVPCRVVFLAGLGAGRFPAGERASGLDLRAASPRRAGDVSPRDRDRQAFLEALLAARERLVVSYLARDEETGEELEPSPLVQELEEMLIEGYLAPEDAARLVERPPLRRWISGSDPVSRRQAACAALRGDLMRHLGGAVPPEAELERALAGRGELAVGLGLGLGASAGAGEETSGGRLARATRAEPLVLTLAAVRRFLECPLQAWASAVLGVRGAEEEDLVQVSVEPFERDLLALSASLRSVFLAHLARGGGIEALEQLHREAARQAEQGGRAPTGPFARGAALRGMRVLTSWRKALEQAAGGLPRAEVVGFGAVREGEVVSRLAPPIEIEVAGRPVLLTGRTEPVADDPAIGSIVLVTGKERSARHWLRGAMDAVALAAAGEEARPHAMTIATATGSVEQVGFAPLGGAEARGYLAELVAELFAAPHDYLLPCEAALPQALGTAKGGLADEVAKLVDKKDGFFSSRGGPLRLPRHVAPPPEGEASEMIARRFRLWRAQP
jgi:exodeoxyribonuclease V gamma subunit